MNVTQCRGFTPRVGLN